jgi:hypothetical protein
METAMTAFLYFFAICVGFISAVTEYHGFQMETVVMTPQPVANFQLMNDQMILITMGSAGLIVATIAFCAAAIVDAISRLPQRSPPPASVD